MTGPKAKPVVTRSVFESTDNGVAWSYLIDSPTEAGILDGICWTADLGKTWTRLETPGTPYYPKAIQLDDGTITLIGYWHAQLARLGGDNQYGTVDQSIKQQTFRLRVTRTP